MSRLDDALCEAQRIESKQAAFYDLFLNSNVFIPVQDKPADDLEPRRSKEGETFAPLLIQHQGKMVLPIFDSEKRLSDWAKREVNFICMPTHALIRSIQSEVYFVLNAGTEYTKEFVPDELKWLRESVETSEPKQNQIPEGTQLLIGSPATIPAGLEEALRDCFARNNEIQAAYLRQVHYQRQGEKPHLVLVLKTAPLGNDAFSAMQTDIGVAIRGRLSPQDYLDIMFYTGSGVSAEIAKLVKPFYLNG